MAAAAARGCGVLNSDMISLISLHGHRCKEALNSASLGGRGEGGGGGEAGRGKVGASEKDRPSNTCAPFDG